MVLHVPTQICVLGVWSKRHNSDKIMIWYDGKKNVYVFRVDSVFACLMVSFNTPIY